MTLGVKEFKDFYEEAVLRLEKILKTLALKTLGLNFSTLTNVVSFEVILVFLSLLLGRFGVVFFFHLYTHITKNVLMQGDIFRCICPALCDIRECVCDIHLLPPK